MVDSNHSAAVTVTGRGSRETRCVASVEVDLLDMARVVTAAADPDLAVRATVRGVDGTVAVDAFRGSCTFRGRSYGDGSDVRADIEGDSLRGLCRFLEGLAASHPLAPTVEHPRDGAVPGSYETTGTDPVHSKLTVDDQGDRILITVAQSGWSFDSSGKVTVPRLSFGNLVRLAGGDIPGEGSLSIPRGSLSFDFNRRSALALYVRTDEVDGELAAVSLDLEQVQELRTLFTGRAADPDQPGLSGVGSALPSPDRSQRDESAEPSPGIDFGVMANALRSLDLMPLPPGIKGLPPERGGEAWTPAGIRRAGFNALRDLPTPFALLIQRPLRQNAEVMARYCAGKGLLLAPHGKTTMAPALWKLQFETGTWALTVALPNQAVTAYRFGIRRILLANEAADALSVERLVELAGRPAVELYCFVDSVEVVRAYRAAADRSRTEPGGLRFLIDIGVPDGRTGCRTMAEAEQVAREIDRCGIGRISGIGAYEGPAGHDRTPAKLAAVDAYLGTVTAIFEAFDRHGLFAGNEPPLLTVGGSDVFDVVEERVRQHLASVASYRLVLRSGCYLVHDHGHYAEVGPSSQPDWPYPPFEGSLVVGATVVSRPQADLALLNVGRRDIGFEAGRASVIDPLPSGGGSPLPIVKLNDQHAFVRPPSPSDLPVGTLVQVGISHPCTTLDKWRVLMIADDDYNIVDAAATIF